MKFTGTLRLMLWLCACMLALCAQAAKPNRLPPPGPLPDKSAIYLVGKVAHIEPFLYTDGMERVTPVVVLLAYTNRPPVAMRVFCVGASISARCSRLPLHARVQLDGELRNLTLVEPTEHGKAELHFPGPAMLRLQVLPSSR